MHLMLGKTPTKKIVYVKEDNTERIEYIATRSRELINKYVEGNIVGGIYTTKQRVADQEGVKVQYGGQWQELQEYLGMKNGVYIPSDRIENKDAYLAENNGFIEDKNSQVKAVKSKEITYEEGESNLEVEITSSVEDYLYKNKKLSEIQKEKNVSFDWVANKNYRILYKEKDILDYIDGLSKTTNIVGFDTETTGLVVGRKGIDILVGMSLSYEDDTGVYFPIAHERIPNVEMGKAKFLELITPYISVNHEETRKDLVTHNGGFDWLVLKREGIELNIVHDTFIRHGLMDIESAKWAGALKAMVSSQLGIDVLELPDMYEDITKRELTALKRTIDTHGLPVNPITAYKLERTDIFKGKEAILPYDFRFASEEFVEIYGPADGDFPRIMYKKQEEQWNKKMDFIYRLEIETIPSLGEQEYFGIKTDVAGLEKLHVKAQEELDEIEKKIYAEAGEEFNIGSSQQKAYILFDKLGCPYLPSFKTKKGGRGTGSKVLKYLSKLRDENGEIKYPIADYLIEYSKLSKLISSFYGNLPRLIHNDLMFTNYKQLGTETGRISSQKPNIQQMEPTVRYLMHVDDEDEYYLMVCDYSQVEYRVMGGLSGEPKVVDFFKTNPEADYHIQAYSNMHGIPYEDVTSKQRSEGKILNFGTTYGLEDANLAQNLYGNSSELHQQMARDARKKYFDGIPVLRDYFEAVRDKAEETGYSETLFGRVRWIPEFRNKNVLALTEYERAKGRRKAGNTPVQGTAADIQKLAMMRIRSIFRKAGLGDDKVRMILNVHDEIGIHVHKSIHPYYVLTLMRRAMEMDLSKYGLPPLYIGAIIGTTWGAGQNDNMEMPVMLMDEIVERVKRDKLKYNTDKSPKELIADWQEEINRFAIRQLKYEIETRGLTTEQECHNTGRMVTYSGYFDNRDAIMKLALEVPSEELQDNYKELLSELSSYKYEAPKEEDKGPKGVEIKDDLDTITSAIKEHVTIDAERGVVRVKLNNEDSKFMEALDAMLVSRGMYDKGVFKEDNQLYRVEVSYIKLPEGSYDPETSDGREWYAITHRGILTGMLKLLYYYMRKHLFDIGTYNGITYKVNHVGETLIKQEYLSK